MLGMYVMTAAIHQQRCMQSIMCNNSKFIMNEQGMTPSIVRHASFLLPYVKKHLHLVPLMQPCVLASTLYDLVLVIKSRGTP